MLTSRDFGAFFLGSSLSNIGTWFQNIAAGLLVYDLTGSTLAVGAVSFAQFLGTVVLAPWAGAAADRYDRRRLLMVTLVGASLVGAGLAGLTYAGLATAPVVIGLSLLLGIALAFTTPALLALVPLLVHDRDLDIAVSLNSVTFNLARAVGPILGALVVGRAGHGAAFGLNAASFLVFLLALVVVRPRRQQVVRGPRPRLRESIRLVRDDPVWTTLLVAVMLVSFSSDPVNTLSPELALDVFGRDEVAVGVLVGAFGGGATLTALTLMPWIRQRRHALAAGMALEGAGIVLVGLAPTYLVAVAGFAVAGGGFIAGVTRATARLQLEVPPAQLGRVMALWSLVFVGSRPVAALCNGVVAELLGARVAAVTIALPVLLGAVWVHRRLGASAPPPQPS